MQAPPEQPSALLAPVVRSPMAGAQPAQPVEGSQATSQPGLSTDLVGALANIAQRGLDGNQADQALLVIQAALAQAVAQSQPRPVAAAEAPRPVTAPVTPAHVPPPSLPPTPVTPALGYPQPTTPCLEMVPVPATPATVAAPDEWALAIPQGRNPRLIANSATHPKEYGQFRRFCERNGASCKEVVAAWGWGPQ